MHESKIEELVTVIVEQSNSMEILQGIIRQLGDWIIAQERGVVNYPSG